MASRKAADSTLYHLSSHGFWKKFRDIVSVNPSISSGLPIASINRYPQPASRPEKYSSPATKASDPAENPYWKRDVRRAYPQLSVITQAELSTLLVGHSEPNVMVSSTPGQPIDLSEAVSAVTQSAKVYTKSRLPPSLPIPHKFWVPQLSPSAPHEPHSYYPMSLYR